MSLEIHPEPSPIYVLGDLYSAETKKFSICVRPNFMRPQQSRFVTFENVSAEKAKLLLDTVNDFAYRYRHVKSEITIENQAKFISGPQIAEQPENYERMQFHDIMIMPIRKKAIKLGLTETTLPNAASFTKIQIPADLRAAVMEASKLAHDLWRSSRKDGNGFKPRWKPENQDGSLQLQLLATLDRGAIPDRQDPFKIVAAQMRETASGGAEIDIANLGHTDQIPQFSDETTAGVLSAVQAILADPRETNMETLASVVHDKWMERHRQLPTEQQNPALLVPYSELQTVDGWDPKEEDRKFVRVAAWAIDKHRLAPISVAGYYQGRPEFPMLAA